jgi:epoxyqueuosine reductase
MADPETIRREHASLVKTWASEEGFAACAIAGAGQADPEGRFAAWLASGHHADMDWLARTRDMREDPRLVLPGARSVVMVAAVHPVRPSVAFPPGHARVARYAWSRDYHRALRKPLKRVADKLGALDLHSQSRVFIDSGPVLERAWGARSGLGWIGRNSLLLRPGLGSWFLMGSILTTVPLATDSPLPDRCGSCTACVDACPTGAILEGRQVDARRCLAYHTIENRGDLPEDIAESLGDRVFGCDICQEVCPWNQRAQVPHHPALAPRPGMESLEPASVTLLDDQAFLERFAGTAVMRAKAAGMRRNATAVIANLRRAEEPPSVGGSPDKP